MSGGRSESSSRVPAEPAGKSGGPDNAGFLKNAVILATDLDGTLVPKGSPVPAAAVRALQKALDAGLAVVPATGRCLGNVPREILQLRGLKYIITSNGAAVTEFTSGSTEATGSASNGAAVTGFTSGSTEATGSASGGAASAGFTSLRGSAVDFSQIKTLMNSLLPWEETAGLLEDLEIDEVYSCIYSENVIINRSRLPRFMSRKDYLPGIFMKNPVDDLPAYVRERQLDAEKIFVAVWEPELREAVRERLRKWKDIVVTSSSTRNLEINRAGTDKGAALKWLAGHLGVDPSRVAAAGDNENDKSMLRFAGFSIAPEGCPPQIRIEADVITGPCEADGVAKYIERMI